MTSTQSKIVALLTARFQPEHLEVQDDSDAHIGHAGHQGGGRHFTVIIKAAAFTGKTRIAAHQLIYAALNELIPDPIHALAIRILN